MSSNRNIKNRNPSDSGDSADRSKINVNTACQIRVGNTEKFRKSLFKSNDYFYDDNKPPENLPGDGDGSGLPSQDNEDDDGDNYESSNWILKNSTKKLTCPHYRQLTSARTAQMTRSKFLINQDTINCCKSGGSETKMGVHDVEDLLAFGMNPYLEESIVLYRRNSQESFGLDVGRDCRIAAIHKDSAAKFNGQLRPGDKILAVNGRRVPTVSLLQKEILKTSSDKLVLKILRSTSPSAMKYLSRPNHMVSSPGRTTKLVEVLLYRPDGQKGFGMTLEGVDSESTGCSVNTVKNGTAADGKVVRRQRGKGGTPGFCRDRSADPGH
jgi:PDZ domain